MYPNNMYKTPEQQIDEAVEISKALFMPQAKSQQEADSIKRNIEAAGDHLKAISAIVNDGNLFKALMNEALSRMR
ncbi:MAG: hypothetical protein IKJ42_10110 [Bacteroidaceae bacterium]|nr:hypothetical protein [Bacteroidaceae bacterium]